MWINQILVHKELWLIIILILILTLSLAALWARNTTQTSVDLKPESVIRAFQDAGFETENIQNIDYYPGPMSPGVQGLEFSTYAGDETFDVLVVLYANDKEAKQVTDAVNDLNSRMKGYYGYAYYRSSIVLLVGAYNESVACEFNNILKKIQK
jgi:hypothetical protein